MRDLPDAMLELTLICEERATYAKGTTTATDTHQAVASRKTAKGCGTPRGFEVETRVSIPIDAGGPTLDLDRNEICWYIEAVLQGPNMPDDERRFPIQVAPIVDPGVRNEIGDR